MILTQITLYLILDIFQYINFFNKPLFKNETKFYDPFKKKIPEIIRKIPENEILSGTQAYLFIIYSVYELVRLLQLLYKINVHIAINKIQ